MPWSTGCTVLFSLSLPLYLFRFYLVEDARLYIFPKTVYALCELVWSLFSNYSGSHHWGGYGKLVGYLFFLVYDAAAAGMIDYKRILLCDTL